MTRFSEFNSTEAWHLLVAAAKAAVESDGFTLSRIPGRGLSNVWKIEKAGETRIASIRTTRDRWIAFPPLDGGKRYKTLDDVDDVLVAAVDRKEDPKQVEVYLIPAQEVRARFDAAYAARTKAGHITRDNYGMWVNLDLDERETATSVGSGLAAAYQPIAIFSLDELATVIRPGDTEHGDEEVGSGAPAQSRSAPPPPNLLQWEEPRTIAEIIAWAKQRIAAVAGVEPDAVKLDLKLEM